MLETASARILCACVRCATAVAVDGTGSYRRMPRNARSLTRFQLSDAQWDALLIPIGLAFFQRSTRLGRVVAMYPGPAGIVESLLPLDAWTEIEAANPELQDLHPDVEALLVYRVNAARQYYIAPIDRCYALAGVLRKKWRGLSGGAEAWESIAHFFAVLDAGSAVQPVGTRHA